MVSTDVSPASFASRIDYGINRAGHRQLRRTWRPDGPVRALALILHGISEHSGRYEAVGRQLAASGIGAVAIDQRGHGETEGPSGYVERFEDYGDDAEDQLAQLREFGVPVILIGHSMGGLIATSYAVSDRPQPDALVLSGPALGVGVPSWQVTLAEKLAQLAPKMRFAPPFDTAVLSRDPAVGEAYDADPLVKPGGATQLLSELLRTIPVTREAIDRLRVPTLCLHGAADELVPAWGSEVLEGHPMVERRVLDNLRHEIFNEPEGPEIVAQVIAWIDAQPGVAAR